MVQNGALAYTHETSLIALIIQQDSTASAACIKAAHTAETESTLERSLGDITEPCLRWKCVVETDRRTERFLLVLLCFVSDTGSQEA